MQMLERGNLYFIFVKVLLFVLVIFPSEKASAQTGSGNEILILPSGEYPVQKLQASCMEQSRDLGCYTAYIQIPGEYEVSHSADTYREVGYMNRDILSSRRNGDIYAVTIPASGGVLEFRHESSDEILLTHRFPAESAGSEMYYQTEVNNRRVSQKIEGVVLDSRSRRRVIRRDSRNSGEKPSNSKPVESNNQGSDVDEQVSRDRIYWSVDEEAKLIGGLENLHRQMEYTPEARSARVEGKVFIQVLVNQQGDVEDPTIIRGLGYGLDENVMYAVAQAKFEPALVNGQPVKVLRTLVINFSLQ